MPNTHPITYSDGRTVASVIAIWDDLHQERSGYYRAFWVAEDDVTGNGSPVVGYCSPGGTFRTVRETVADARRRYPGVPVYRNGREVHA